MPFVDIEDARVEYRADGTGPGLLLVHGAGGDADSHWGTLTSRLARQRTVVRPNYAGSGATEYHGATLTLEGLSRQVMASAWSARAVPFDLVGYSLGAGVAAYLAVTMPDLVRSLVLVGAFADARDPGRGRLWQELIDRDGDIPRDAAHQAGMQRQLALELGLDLRPLLAGIRCPTLVVAGTHDPLRPPSHAQVLAAAIPDARVRFLPTTHLAPQRHPDALAGIIDSFLSKTVDHTSSIEAGS